MGGWSHWSPDTRQPFALERSSVKINVNCFSSLHVYDFNITLYIFQYTSHFHLNPDPLNTLSIIKLNAYPIESKTYSHINSVLFFVRALYKFNPCINSWKQ